MTQIRTLVILLACLFTGSQAEQGNFYPVQVSVYYSVMCENCRAFFTAKLEPYYEDFKQWIDIDFIPFGNSTHLDSGNFEFECPEGPDECRANKWHSCANAIYRGEKPHLLFSFLNCTLWKDDHFYGSLNKCARESNLDFLPIQHCTNSFEGDVHLAANAARTAEHTPAISSFPTIEFNGTFDQELQNLAVMDFKKAICSQIKDPVTQAMPDVCESSAPQVIPALALLLCAINILKVW